MNLLRLDSQPNFPHKDISIADAELLELLLQNPTLFDRYHLIAEKVHLLFSLGHNALTLAATAYLDDPRQLAAFSHGIGAYEVVAGIMRPEAQTVRLLENYTAGIGVLRVTQSLEEDFVTTLTDATDRLQEKLPRTHQAISESAMRFHRGHQNYAQHGAAIMHEIDTLVSNAA